MEKPLVYHGLSMSIQNKALTVVSKQRLKTTPTFALEKQTRLERKQTRFILTLPVAGAVPQSAVPKQTIDLSNDTPVTFAELAGPIKVDLKQSLTKFKEW